MLKIPNLNTIYPSKLILFGEYTVLIGGLALALPIRNYTSNWSTGQRFPHNSLHNYIEEVLQENNDCSFNKNMWLDWLAEMGFLKSSIPVGYGLGSSGNLIAAIFNDFVIADHSVLLDLNKLRMILGKMESYFHESSSGIDPLVCYLSKSIVIEQGNVNVIEGPMNISNFYLFDSNQSRNTKELVQKFKREMQNVEFCESINNLMHLNNVAIKHLIQNEKSVSNVMKEISLLQYQTMIDWIPGNIRKLWESGLNEDSYYFKLCGAGGGGFFLVYCEKNHNEKFLPIIL